MRPRGLEERFAFLAPNIVNAVLIKTKPVDVIMYVLDLFVARKDLEKLFFLPYNTGNELDFLSNFILIFVSFT